MRFGLWSPVYWHIQLNIVTIGDWWLVGWLFHFTPVRASTLKASIFCTYYFRWHCIVFALKSRRLTGLRKHYAYSRCNIVAILSKRWDALGGHHLLLVLVGYFSGHQVTAQFYSLEICATCLAIGLAIVKSHKFHYLPKSAIRNKRGRVAIGQPPPDAVVARGFTHVKEHKIAPQRRSGIVMK